MILGLFPPEPIKKPSVRHQGKFIISGFITFNPPNQHIEILVLFLERRVLVRLPLSVPAIFDARFYAWVQKIQFCCSMKNKRNEIRITPLYDPAFVFIQKRIDEFFALGQLFPDWNLGCVPRHGVEIEVNKILIGGKPFCQGRLSRSRIAEYDDPAHDSSLHLTSSS